jgi:hypothetical protein
MCRQVGSIDSFNVAWAVCTFIGSLVDCACDGAGESNAADSNVSYLDLGFPDGGMVHECGAMD